ncbi:hypothetical protein T439DRAFT_252851 [Meredithblackwellia eburnea MCA 4105]
MEHADCFDRLEAMTVVEVQPTSRAAPIPATPNLSNVSASEPELVKAHFCCCTLTFDGQGCCRLSCCTIS